MIGWFIRSFLVFMVYVASAGVSFAEGLPIGEESANPGLSLWDRALRGFRSDHNILTSISGELSKWSLALSDQVQQQIETKGIRGEFSYSFHLPIANGFGYYLGSSLGLSKEELPEDVISASYTTMLPGLDFGLVWNVNTQWRFELGYSFGWQRIDALRFKTSLGSRRVSVTGESRSYTGSLDYFFAISDAVRFEYEVMSIRMASPGNLNLEKATNSLKFGYLKHLL